MDVGTFRVTIVEVTRMTTPADDGRVGKRGVMETLSQAVDRLERRGYRKAFRAIAHGMLELPNGPRFEPESLVVDEVVRFEGVSDPEDEAVLFALRAPDADDVRGTFVASYGVQGDPLCALAVQRLDLSDAE
jgi:hypothetical protein